MLSRHLSWVALVGTFGGLFAFGGCSAANDDAKSTSGTGSGTGGGGGNGGINIGGDIGVGGGCASTCTADLKKVIDCDGNFVEECPGDQACLGGVCGNDPCGAAEASKSSYGCDYWALKPDLITDGSGACFAAYIANTWSVPVHISVARDGVDLGTNSIVIPQGQGQGITYAPYDPNEGLPVGEVAIAFLARQPGGGLPDCPVPAALNVDGGILGSGRGSAFNITTDRPVVAYSILPYGGGQSAATSASLLLPTSAWDDNYIAINAYAKSTAAPVAQPSLNVLAYQDATEVTVLPKVAIVGGGGVTGGPANMPVTYTLDAGEYIQLSQDQELTGSPIQSNKPVGLWGGASCLSVPVAAIACDSAHQQIPPVRALGSNYAGVRYKNRSSATAEETPPWRIVGAVDGTQLTWTPSAPAGAPMMVNQGEVFEFNAAGPMVVGSQDGDHPFYFAQYMTGANHVGAGGEGDPEWVNVIPVDQYLDNYVFFTDPTYPETSLVVTRRRSSSGDFAEVTLDCLGTLTGWQAVGDLEYTRVDLVTGNFQNVGSCSNGRHEMSSDTPFGVTVWGWGSAATGGFSSQYVSYAYPAGASVQSINEVVIPPTPK